MEPQAFNRAVGAHQDRIYSHALAVLRDADDAADVTQEAFLRLWRHGRDLPDEAIRPWLLRVVHNLCLDQKRRQGARLRNFGRPDPEAVERLAGDPDRDLQPEADLLEEARRQEILTALGTLNPEARSVVLMHYYQGMKIKDIARDLGKNLNSVKVQIHRARKALRLVLGEESAALAAGRREIG